MNIFFNITLLDRSPVFPEMAPTSKTQFLAWTTFPFSMVILPVQGNEHVCDFFQGDNGSDHVVSSLLGPSCTEKLVRVDSDNEILKLRAILAVVIISTISSGCRPIRNGYPGARWK